MKKAISITMAAVIVLISAAFLALPASAGEYITTHNLPAEYVELEYIECDGRQIINTGIKATPKTSFEVTFQVTNTTVGTSDEDKAAGKGGSGSYKGIIGVNWGGGGGDGYNGRLQISYGRTDDCYSIALGNKANKDFKKDTVKHTLVMDAANSKAIFDGSEVISIPEGNNLSDEKLGLIGLGGTNYTSSTTEWNDYQSLAAAKIYYAKISNDGAVQGEFIPAYRVADQKVGMYDLVTKTFFENVHETVLKDDTGAETRTLHGFAMPADAVLTAPAATTGSSGTSTTSPATGDNTVYLFTAVAAAAAVLCIAVVSVSRRAFAGKQD